jgi:hypothetical protein
VDREFGRFGYGDSYRPSNSELMAMIQLRADCWCLALNAGLPAGDTVANIRAWLISEGWATTAADLGVPDRCAGADWYDETDVGPC